MPATVATHHKWAVSFITARVCLSLFLLACLSFRGPCDLWPLVHFNILAFVSAPKHRRDRDRRILAWFMKHMPLPTPKKYKTEMSQGL